MLLASTQQGSAQLLAVIAVRGQARLLVEGPLVRDAVASIDVASMVVEELQARLAAAPECFVAVRPQTSTVALHAIRRHSLLVVSLSQSPGHRIDPRQCVQPSPIPSASDMRATRRLHWSAFIRSQPGRAHKCARGVQTLQAHSQNTHGHELTLDEYAGLALNNMAHALLCL